MTVAVLCEFSGIVRDAFIRQGHEAISCDLEPSESLTGPHIQGDCRDYNWSLYDLIIAHPPCRYLAVSGARWFRDRRDEQEEAIRFFMWCVNLGNRMIAVENPVSVMSTRYRKPDQIIQPWQYGHGETKAICLWLKNLPKLSPTEIVDGREHRIHKMAPGRNRSRERSRFFTGIAQAMAKQWGE